MTLSFETMRTLSVADARTAIRNGDYVNHTAGLASGCLQANLAILPLDYAADFERFCALNPRPCPLVGKTAPGLSRLPTLGGDLDLKGDVPRYNVYRNGVLSEQVTQLSAHWRDDLVGFALGCSFTFENAFLRAGIPVWHIANNRTVPMYRTNIALTAVGPFKGHMVVSMRAIDRGQIDQAKEISGKFPWAHGAPVHVGDASEIGISDIHAPDWGDPAPIEEGKVPCFWACGVTPQSVVIDAKLPLVITHTPGHMLITDVAEDTDARISTKSE